MTACSKVVSSQYSKYFKDYGYPYRAQDVFECEFILMEAMAHCKRQHADGPLPPLPALSHRPRSSLTAIVLGNIRFTILPSKLTLGPRQQPPSERIPFKVKFGSPHPDEDCFNALKKVERGRNSFLARSSRRNTVVVNAVVQLPPLYQADISCLQLAFISLEKNPPADASYAANDSASLSAACGGHNNSFPITNRQSKVSPLAVAEHWFSELTVNMEKV
ncbi:unnamed protein product [Dibothriocephalus latus]|uniref:Uncharacterized protein n=1 Tax=Dibothriocephalus latus TaxID=60516 RepID=A0A3P7LVF2_DIBLA|nr:unnamed protein product [Dibothriocephalus latus]